MVKVNLFMRAPVWVEVVRNRFSHGAALTRISMFPFQKFMTGLDFSKKRVEGLAFLVLGWSPYVRFLMHAVSMLFFVCLSHATARNFVERTV
jgi:hypothetical protein